MKDHSEHIRHTSKMEHNTISTYGNGKNNHHSHKMMNHPVAHNEKHVEISQHYKHKGHSVEGFKKRFIISLALTIPVLITSHMIREFLGLQNQLHFPGDQYVLFALSSAVFFYGGMPFLIGFYREIKNLLPGMMTLIAIAITIAYLYSSAVVFGLPGEDFFWELATLIDIMLLGHWLEMRAVMSASHALEELQKLLPDIVSRIEKSGEITEIDISELKNGDILLIRPGEKIPADGIVTEGKSSVNESMITGEFNPVPKETSAGVLGGSVNGGGSLKIKIEKTGDETFLSHVMKLVKEAQESKSKTQNLADRAAFYLTIFAIASGALTMAGWLILGGADFHFALSRTVTVMIIACPHALGLAIPLVVSVSTALSAKKGLLIRNRTAFEEARRINAVVFDKTGTLTKGEFGVTGVISYSTQYPEKEILKYAASVESESEHPIAKAVIKHSAGQYPLTNFNSIPGKGAEGIINGQEVKVVSHVYLSEKNISVPAAETYGKTVIYIVINNQAAGAIELADMIREESKAAVSQLKKMGIKSIMLTGDNRNAAESVSREVGLDDYFAEVLPADKAKKIQEVKSQGMITAMIGDGVNDAPALAAADVGIAVGAGTDVAVETADIILVRNNPEDVVSLIKFAKGTYRKMIQNLIWATGYNIIAIPLAAGVFYSAGIMLNPALGAALMSLSTIVVAVNARMLKI